EEQFVVFIGRPLEVADKALDLVGHLIERQSQFAQLSSAQHPHAPGEVASRDAMGASSQLAYRPRQLFREIESNEQGERCGQQADKESLIAHIAYRRHSRSFVLNRDYP